MRDDRPIDDATSVAGQIDRGIFATALLVVVGVCLPIMLWPAQAGTVITGTYDWIAHNFGILYVWTVIGIVVFLGWIAFGRHGSHRLGGPGTEQEFSTFSWVAMLFCGGVGAGLVYWATIEWASYLDGPPFGAAPDSPEALSWATSYGLFHWGLIAWTIYALPTVAISVPFYSRRVNFLRFSASCSTFIGNREEHPGARAIDAVFMLALLAGAATSMGLAVPMISAACAEALGLTRSFWLDVAIVAICVALFAGTVFLGLEKGIQRLADLNVLLAFGLLAFIVIAGPTLFILRTGTESLGFMLQNMPAMLTYTEPMRRSSFVEDWTIFYWAWWLAFGPFVGIFVTRISRGRTLRQLILSMALFGSLGAWVFYIVLGNYALYLDLNGIVPVREIMSEVDPAQAIAAVIGSLPASGLVLLTFALLCIIFIATTYNSAAYALASSATRRLGPGEDPGRWHRLFWAFVVGILPVALMSVEGGTKVVTAAVLVASLPLIGIALLMCINLVRCLREEDSSHAT
ncbi:MAG: BCCT family transporter [Proteobacteria bacterium]|jgi:BCCT family betaine/carnitine transporter|nr:BCCT family transporter [Pseudomonadota bacterium]MDA1033850.1 BCCT family transporter [Pseudomonadota bacterium]